MKIPYIGLAVLAGLRGSHAHGTTIDPEDDERFGTDDLDVMEVVVLPRSYYIGLDTFGFSSGTREVAYDSLDLVAYEARKFMGLLLKGNPSTLSLLWLDSYMKITPAGQLLVDARERLTLTRKTVSSMIGYASGQLKSLDKEPTKHAYMGERRMALVQEFGYDVKRASHSVRLLRMLVGLLEDGVLYVDRSGMDAEDLVAIKRGAWSRQEVVDEVHMRLAQARELESTLSHVDLPDAVDRVWASDLCRRVIEAEWS